jgi:hypothetical protein
MPFAARDFGGKWQFVMDNLTCGTMDVTDATTGQTRTIPIPVANERRNKGKFISDFSNAIQAEYPELAEAFISLREPACIVDIPICTPYPSPYPYQNYESANTPCPDTSAGTGATLTFTPVLQATTNTYEVAANSVTCNGMLIVHDALTGTATLADLVAQMNLLLPAMGTWSVSGGNITLTATNCTTVSIPWTV